MVALVVRSLKKRRFPAAEPLHFVWFTTQLIWAKTRPVIRKKRFSPKILYLTATIVVLLSALATLSTRAAAPSYADVWLGETSNPYGDFQPLTPLGFSAGGGALFGLSNQYKYANVTIRGFSVILGANGPVQNQFDGEPVGVSDDGSVVLLKNGTLWRETLNSEITVPGCSSVTAELLSGDGETTAGSAYSGEIGGVVWRRDGAGNVTVLPLGENEVPEKVWASNGMQTFFAKVPRYLVPSVSFRSLKGIHPRVGSDFFHWDAAGNRTQIALPVGYELASANPPVDFSNNDTAVILLKRIGDGMLRREYAVHRWTPNGSTTIALPKRFDENQTWSDLIISEDGAVFTAQSSIGAVRYANGSFTELGRFTPQFLNHDGSLLLGLADFFNSRRPAAWSPTRGVVFVEDQLGLQTGAVAKDFEEGDWRSMIFGIRGSNVVFAGISPQDYRQDRYFFEGNPLYGKKPRFIEQSGHFSVGEVSITSLTGPDPFGGTLLDDGIATKASVRLWESVDSYELHQKVGGKPTTVIFDGPTIGGMEITASMEGVDLASITADSPFEIFVGPLKAMQTTLAKDTSADGFRPGETTAEFHGYQGGPSPIRLSWDQAKLTITMNGVWYRDLINRINLSEGSRRNIAIPLRVRFAGHSGVRGLRLDAAFGPLKDNKGRTILEEHDKILIGGFDPGFGEITGKLPANGTTFNNRHIALSTPLVTSGTSLWMRLNNGEWTQVFTADSAIQIHLASGENTVVFESRDSTGKVLANLTRTYHYLPKAGNYTALLASGETRPGFINLLVTESGAFSGKLHLDGKNYKLRGTFDATGRTSLKVNRGKRLPPLEISLELALEADTNLLSATVAIPQNTAPTLTLTGTGGRANWDAPEHLSVQESTSDLFFHALIQPGPGAPDAVPGSGIFGFTLKKSSIISGKGKLADGTAFSFSAPLNDALQAPMFVTIGKGKQRVAGVLDFDFNQLATDVTGSLRWTRKASSKGPFAEGWDFPVNVHGSRNGHPAYRTYNPLLSLRCDQGGLAAPTSFVFTNGYYGVQPLEKNKPILSKPVIPQGFAGSFFDAVSKNKISFECLIVSKSQQSGGFTSTPAGAGIAQFIAVAGSADGAGNKAQFNTPFAIAYDPTTDSVIVADADNHTIRRVTAAGVVTTIAGRPMLSDYADGPGAGARFFKPSGIAVDASGNIFVADKFNFAIRKITPSGMVSTFAGRGFGTNGSGGSYVSLSLGYSHPQPLAFSGADLLTFSYREIVKITPQAVVTYYDPPSNDYGHSIAADPAGHIYYDDLSAVRKLTGQTVTYLAGTSDYGYADGPGATAKFNDISCLAADASGNIFVADSGNHVIRKISPDGNVTTVAGTPKVPGNTDGPAARAKFYTPRGVCVDPSGNIYVADTDNHLIRKITPDGMVSTLAGSR